MSTTFEARIYRTDWRATHEVALAVTRQAGEPRGQAAILMSSGLLAVIENRLPDARRLFGESLAVAASVTPPGSVDDALTVAMANRGLAWLERMEGNTDEAVRWYRTVLTVLHDIGDRAAEAYMLGNLAQVERDRGDAAGAAELLFQALALSREPGNRRIETQLLHLLGHARLAADDPAGAAARFGEALAAERDLGDPIGRAYLLHGLGLATRAAATRPGRRPR
ncbi:tetratricopeptide repeat protein [Actinoplanes sp. G11-F43]|uniref:tetratricopeptide repeat protein n=1 Tax=Actinoplanes sp. G11-F43 TaxID=3424130 RepID=UPI003D3477AB